MFKLSAAFAQLRRSVEGLLACPERLSKMTPWMHVEWALSLPKCDGSIYLPDALGSVLEATVCDPEGVRKRRIGAINFWQHRKRVTAPKWAELFRNLQAHVQIRSLAR